MNFINMNFGELLFALNCDPLKNKIRKIEKINKSIVQTKNGIHFNEIYIYIYIQWVAKVFDTSGVFYFFHCCCII